MDNWNLKTKLNGKIQTKSTELTKGNIINMKETAITTPSNILFLLTKNFKCAYLLCHIAMS